MHPPGLKGWTAAQREKSLAWAREQETSPSPFRRKAGATLIENNELLSQGRALSRVYRKEQKVIVHPDGQHEVREVEVLKRVPSTLFAVLGTAFAVGSVIAFVGYGFALVGGGVFACIAAGARRAKRDDIAVPAARLSALTTMAVIPVVGNAFPMLIVASEVTALAAMLARKLKREGSSPPDESQSRASATASQE